MMSRARVDYSAEGCERFNSLIEHQLKLWWTKRGLAHWLPRVRLALWMFDNCYLITKCVLEEGKRLRLQEGRNS